MPATNDPIAVKDVARPAANATGPSLCSATAAPNIIGVRGNTHGDRIESNPARNANGRVAIPILFSHGLSQQRFDHFGSSLADCSLHFLFVPVKHEHGDLVG